MSRTFINSYYYRIITYYFNAFANLMPMTSLITTQFYTNPVKSMSNRVIIYIYPFHLHSIEILN